MRGRKKVVWNTPSGVRPTGGTTVPTKHVGHFASTARFWEGVNEKWKEKYESGFENNGLFVLSQDASIVSNAWDGTDAEEGQVSYLSPRNPTGKGTFKHYPRGTLLTYIGERRLTEWDGKGWSRPIRPLFVIDGTIVAVVFAGDVTPM